MESPAHMQRPLIIGLIGAVLVGIGIILAWLQFTSDAPDRSGPAPQASAPPSLGTPAAPSAAPGTRPRVDAPQISPRAPFPTFDVVRINPSGDVVIAGRAAPNAAVTIYDGTREIGRATADQRGEWVFLPNEPLPAGSRELSPPHRSRARRRCAPSRLWCWRCLSAARTWRAGPARSRPSPWR